MEGVYEICEAPRALWILLNQLQTFKLVFIEAVPLTLSVRINDRTFRFLLDFDKKNISYLEHRIGTFQLSSISDLKTIHYFDSWYIAINCR